MVSKKKLKIVIRREVKIWTVITSGYATKKKVNYSDLGEVLDQIIQSNFLGKTIVMRLVGSQDHHKTVTELVPIIKKTGTDRYDPQRKMIFHDFYAKHNPDLFASLIKVSTLPIMAKQLEEFYSKTIGDRKKGIRADIITLYNQKSLRMIKHVYDDQEERDCFTFKDPQQKRKALLGIIMIES